LHGDPEIYVGSSDPGGEARKFSFKASRQGLSSSNYTAQAIATWRSLLDETKLVNVVWKQIPAINLPFSTTKISVINNEALRAADPA
jgi:hypothetical protein